MKTIKTLLAIILLVATGSGLTAQTTAKQPATKTESIKVLGNCDMCKTRIEKAAKTDGVKSASWDSKTKLLTLNYDPSKTSIDAVEKNVAAVGHDTEKYKAEDKVYNALPGCCKYDRDGNSEAAAHTHTH
ncbi:MAG TPA: heavy-metal-associated domain-containing protein [Bacteroidales bacterium]|nr:heavy-metal-associated domain-containing protein [Bacteroidales bacterium]